MNAKDVFVDNMVTVLDKSKVKDLVRQANEQGVAIDYTYFMDVRRGSRNPSADKSEQIVTVLRLLPGYDWIEHWMFFVPEYFKQHSSNVLESKQSPEHDTSQLVNELLVMACRFKIIKLEQLQFEQMQELAQFIIQQKNPDKSDAQLSLTGSDS
ncbi:hypothetical protein J8L98_23165 [Pseudoalteromonas sp. MMG013]|uniref:hypothetical protein n=1 Tax=Pseudoalteromonas sp. MMG013 TaxID=2822687 RepID=UPI001B37248A|nr:hypothetical protein [Pseudoalteromonas sp. MMG013]MBQ4864587.1 hypothetical protein [Pseudoalteromonas sp. MMG013]